MVMKSRVWVLRENPPKCGSLSWNAFCDILAAILTASMDVKICCCCKILVENKRHHLHESAKGGTWKLSHFGWLPGQPHMQSGVFLHRSLINTFPFPSSTKPPNNCTWKVFVVQQLPAIFQFWILDWETPLQNEKEPKPTPFLCVQDIAIYSYNSIFHCKLQL
jgi:hypothetical protein